MLVYQRVWTMNIPWFLICKNPRNYGVHPIGSHHPQKHNFYGWYKPSVTGRFIWVMPTLHSWSQLNPRKIAPLKATLSILRTLAWSWWRRRAPWAHLPSSVRPNERARMIWRHHFRCQPSMTLGGERPIPVDRLGQIVKTASGICI